MLERVAEHDRTPLVISVVSMTIALLSLLVTVIMLINNAELKGRYEEQSQQNQLQGIQIMTLEAYVNSLRLIMKSAGVQTPDPPKLPTELVISQSNNKKGN